MKLRLFSSLARSIDGSLNNVTKSKTPYEEQKLTDLIRAWTILKLSSSETIAKNGEKLYSVSNKVLGKRISSNVMKNTFFRHYVGGTTVHNMMPIVERFNRHGVKIMILPPMEDLIGDISGGQIKMCNENRERYLHLISEVDTIIAPVDSQPVMQFKLTGNVPMKALDEYSDHLVKQSIPMLDSASDIAEYMSGQSEKLKICPNENVREMVEMGIRSCDEIFAEAKGRGIPILIDAELKSSHPGMYAIFIGSSAVHSRDYPALFCTYQNYMTHIPETLLANIETAKKLNCSLGIKLVRGAYLHLEQQIAEANGDPNPIWPSLEDTHRAYNFSVAKTLEKVKEDPTKTNLFICTHNQESIDFAVGKMKQLGISKYAESVKFAQVYGMSDHLGYKLARDGYHVYKSIPVGGVDEWVPYLGRRAAENYSALQSSRNELPFYVNEMKRRFRLNN